MRIAGSVLPMYSPACAAVSRRRVGAALVSLADSSARTCARIASTADLMICSVLFSIFVLLLVSSGDCQKTSGCFPNFLLGGRVYPGSGTEMAQKRGSGTITKRGKIWWVQVC